MWVFHREMVLPAPTVTNSGGKLSSWGQYTAKAFIAPPTFSLVTRRDAAAGVLVVLWTAVVAVGTVTVRLVAVFTRRVNINKNVFSHAICVYGT